MADPTPGRPAVADPRPPLPHDPPPPPGWVDPLAEDSVLSDLTRADETIRPGSDGAAAGGSTAAPRATTP